MEVRNFACSATHPFVDIIPLCFPVQVKLKYFIKYMERQRDDSPLYIFDSHFDDYEESKALLRDYSVPDYFPDDLFSLVGERRRPPYR